jgi:hypothetical protein
VYTAKEFSNYTTTNDTEQRISSYRVRKFKEMRPISEFNIEI